MLTSVTRFTVRIFTSRRLARYPLLLLTGMVLSVVGYIQSSNAADPLQGARSYQSNCINCHGANGAGEIPNIPDFSRGERLLQPDDTLMETIKSGKGMMPAFQGRLSENDILDVIAYLRTLQ